MTQYQLSQDSPFVPNGELFDDSGDGQNFVGEKTGTKVSLNVINNYPAWFTLVQPYAWATQGTTYYYLDMFRTVQSGVVGTDPATEQKLQAVGNFYQTADEAQAQA